MADPETILTEHYKAVREEEMERIRHRDQYLILFVSASGVIGGVYVTDPKWWGLLVVVPLFAVVTAFLYAHTDVTLGALSHWLRYKYTEMIAAYRAANNITFELQH